VWGKPESICNQSGAIPCLPHNTNVAHNSMSFVVSMPIQSAHRTTDVAEHPAARQGWWPRSSMCKQEHPETSMVVVFLT